MSGLGRYLRLPTSNTGDPPDAEGQRDEDPLAIELRPLSWKEELSTSLDNSLFTRILLLLAPILPNHPPTFPSLRRLITLSVLLTLILLLSSFVYLQSGRILTLRTPPCPNAFRLPGTLHVNAHNASDNYWLPTSNSAPDYPPHCPRDPPRLLESLQAFEASSSALSAAAAAADESISPLVGRTILLFGDSIDRLHLEHFCSFFGVQPGVIHPRDTVYPHGLTQLEKQLSEELGREFGSDRSRPWVCHLPRSDLLLLWVFYPGSDDGQTAPPPPQLPGHPPPPPAEPATGPWGEKAFWPAVSEHFNPPLKAEERLTRLALPLLANLRRRHVDLVELGLGAWDLDLAKRLDNLSAKYAVQSQGAGEEEEVRLTEEVITQPLSAEFLSWVKTRTQEITSAVLHAFPSSTPVYLRPLGQTPQYYHWPYLIHQSRIAQVQELARDIVSQHRKEQSTWFGGRRRARLRMDNIGELVRGEERWEDHIHPGMLPGSWVWGEWVLYALSRSVQRNAQ